MDLDENTGNGVGTNVFGKGRDDFEQQIQTDLRVALERVIQ